ncbi:MFS transporter [Clostridium sp. CS001]|uniref:MFS transporter n=1 Tax=Clostridium sp. CS001 TaxID=2880648 RepID=UPI001CF2664E|nr:MFS transporter [Clostridium sp. CS001]MCB2291770.1 MFS transporter [Clostridium sp. CS001]
MEAVEKDIVENGIKTKINNSEKVNGNELEVTEKNKSTEKLWTLNFFLLWQGQMVSALGDVFYEIALGFWVLAVTGSTGLMGTLMAASALPRIIISPFAGVIVDRCNRRNMIVLMDLVRGVVITAVGTAAILGVVEIWMVFAAGVILGICAAFFNPAVGSAVPDIVPRNKIIQANSALNMAGTGINILANPLGGVVYQLLGAPIMFLSNGISYLFSAFTEIFIKIPKIERKVKAEDAMKSTKENFKQELKEGFKFVWKFKGLRYLIIEAAGLNFFCGIAMVLILPLFQRTQGLGAGKYGIAMALLTGGMFAGMALTSIVKIPYERRLSIFMISGVVFAIGFAVFPMVNFRYMLVLLFIAGFFNAIVNTLISASIQLTVPQDMRGKVFSIMNTVCGGLMPIAMAVGGILAEFISIKYIILTCFLLSGIGILPLGITKNFKRFINFNPDCQTLEDII